jgi:hypothetical protein
MQKRRIALRVLIIVVVAALLAWPRQTAQAQFNPVAVDGVISPGEYGLHLDGQNQQASGGTTWYMTWDDTNLYIGIANATLGEGAVVYIDMNPILPINGGTDADGNLAGQPYDNTNFAALPFRADFVTYFKNGYREYRTATGGGIWSAPTTFFGAYAEGAGNVRELAIPWTAIAAAGRPAAFTWYGYVTSGAGFVYAPVPVENPAGSIGTTARYPYYYAIKNTDNLVSTKPFALKSYTFNAMVDRTLTDPVLFDITMNTAGRTLTCGGTCTLNGNLWIESGAFQLASSATTLAIRRNFTNHATFIHNNGMAVFDGTKAQTIAGTGAGALNFYDLTIDNSVGLPEGVTVAAGSAPVDVAQSLRVNSGRFFPNNGSEFGNLLINAAGSVQPVTTYATLTVYRDFENNGAFLANYSTLVFNGSMGQIIRGDSAFGIHFYNLTIANTATPDDNNDVQCDKLIDVAGALTVADGQFTTYDLSSFFDVFIEASGIVKPPLGTAFKVAGDFIVNDGAFIHNDGTVIFNGLGTEHTVGGTAQTTFKHIVVNPTARLVFPAGITSAIASGGTVLNDGVLKQTQAVAGISAVNFVGLGGVYGGVTIRNQTSGNELGNTIVLVGGNRDCTTIADEFVQRCFEITPDNKTGRLATLTFFFSPAELAGHDCNNLVVWHHNGVKWDTKLPPDTSYGGGDGRICEGSLYSIQVKDVTEFSKFGVRGDSGDPTAVTVQKLGARPAVYLWAGGLAALALALGGARLARRRRK